MLDPCFIKNNPTDFIIFSVVHLAFFGFFLLALVKNALLKRPGKIFRGSESQKYFYLSYGFMSAIIMLFIQVSDAYKGHKILISMVDLGLLFYLSFWNGWFRQMLIGKLNFWKTRPE